MKCSLKGFIQNWSGVWLRNWATKKKVTMDVIFMTMKYAVNYVTSYQKSDKDKMKLA